MIEISKLADQLEVKTAQGRKALELMIQNVQLLDSKQMDYGPDNILINGEIGVVVRAQDKLSRLRHLYTHGDEKVLHESIVDSWRDLSNYGVIGEMLELGVWVPEGYKPNL